jgi:hypothetical protein
LPPCRDPAITAAARCAKLKLSRARDMAAPPSGGGVGAALQRRRRKQKFEAAGIPACIHS